VHKHTQRWHLALRLSLHEATAAFACQSSVYVSVVFLRYPALQQTLPMYLIVSNVIIIMSVNTSNPVTAM
jgi:hypothetical protein